MPFDLQAASRLLQTVHRTETPVTGLKPRSYCRDFLTLTNISFEIRHGETIGVIGRNGSGKSILLQTICGTLSPTSGSAEPLGSAAALLELGTRFNPEFTGRENVYSTAMIFGFVRVGIDARFADIVAFSGIGEFLDYLVKTSSSVMHVRLAFSIAINVEPDILIVDEALSIGDARFQLKCMTRIRTFQANSSTILFVGRDVKSLRMLCDRAMCLDDSQLCMGGYISQVTARFTEFLLDRRLDDFSMPMVTWTAAPPVPIEVQQSTLAARSDTSFDKKPVTYWGPHIDCIQTAGIYRNGTRKDAFPLGEGTESPARQRTTRHVQRGLFDQGSERKRFHHVDHARLGALGIPWRKPIPSALPAPKSTRSRHYKRVAAVGDRSSPTAHDYECLSGTRCFSSTSNARLFAPIST